MSVPFHRGRPYLHLHHNKVTILHYLCPTPKVRQAPRNLSAENKNCEENLFSVHIHVNVHIFTPSVMQLISAQCVKCNCYRVPEAELSLTHPGEACGEDVSISGEDGSHWPDPLMWSQTLLQVSRGTDISKYIQCRSTL